MMTLSLTVQSTAWEMTANGLAVNRIAFNSIVLRSILVHPTFSKKEAKNNCVRTSYMNLSILQKEENFSTSWATGGLSKRIPVRKVWRYGASPLSL
jgi:hypothetical protein